MNKQGLIDDICVVQLRANDFDWSRHLNNAVYFQLLEQARWSWTNHNNIDLRHSELVGVVSNLEINYLKPIEWDPLQRVKISTKALNISAYSITLSQIIYRNDDKIAADAKLRLALLNIKTNKLNKLDIERIRNAG